MKEGSSLADPARMGQIPGRKVELFTKSPRNALNSKG